MRKVLTIVIVSVLLLASFAHVALADPQPDAAHTPKPIAWPGPFAPTEAWIELNPDAGGNGIELPQGGNNPGFFGVDDFIRGGPAGGGFQHGIPIGFNFKFMQGPPQGIPEYGWTDTNGNGILGDAVGGITDTWEAQMWNYDLFDEGFDELYVSLNGYVVFDTVPVSTWALGARPEGEFGGLGTRAWFPTQLQSADVPNEFIAPFWTDLTIADNAFQEVTAVCFLCDAPDGQVRARRSLCTNLPGKTGEYVVCGTRDVERPRGHLLYRTVGTAPNRKFVVEWANAKNIWTSDLATFQLQLWEGTNTIVFLYKEFKAVSQFEDPSHDSPYTINRSLLVGMEDATGNVAVGQAYMPGATPIGWDLLNPLHDGDVLVFAQ
jgi:hypothetical protein